MNSDHIAPQMKEPLTVFQKDQVTSIATKTAGQKDQYKMSATLKEDYRLELEHC